MRVDVAVIPAAGRGTRMLPATRSVPKAFLPLIDRPAIQWIIEEGMRAGATEFAIVVDPGVDELLFRHFEGVRELPGFEDIVIRSIPQQKPMGLGDAILQARDFVEGRPFFCLLADNLVIPESGDVLPTLASASDGRSVVALRELTDDQLKRYGVIEPGAWVDDGVIEVLGAVEKPGPHAAPSKLGLIGRYLLNAQIFDELEGLGAGYGGEVQLTDAIAAVGAARRCLGAVAPAELLDIGNPLGYIEANAALGLAHPDLGDEFRAFIERQLGRS